MKGMTFCWLCLIVVAAAMPLESALKGPTYEVNRPTILAFFPPATEAELKHDSQVYAGVRERLAKRGIEFREVWAHSFTIRMGNAATTFNPKRENVGIYLVAPGKKPRVQYGVMTDADLLQLADEYFGSAKK